MKEYLFVTPSFSFVAKATGAPRYVIPLPKAIAQIEHQEKISPTTDDTTVLLHFEYDGDRYRFLTWSTYTDRNKL